MMGESGVDSHLLDDAAGGRLSSLVQCHLYPGVVYPPVLVLNNYRVPVQ